MAKLTFVSLFLVIVLVSTGSRLLHLVLYSLTQGFLNFLSRTPLDTNHRNSRLT